MSKQRSKGRRQTVSVLLGVAFVSMAAFGVFAGSAGSASDRASEMPTPRYGPSIIGTARDGETLTAQSGQWLYADGLGCKQECVFTWQWQRCTPQATSCSDIPGKTQQTYTIAGEDVRNKVRISQTLTKYDCDALNQNCKYVSSNQVSSPSNIVEPKAATAPANTQLPAITGTPMEEETLSTSTGLWTGEQPISVAFQWYRCNTGGTACAAIPAATAQTYVLTAGEVGSTVRVTGTATNRGGTSSATSAPTAVIAAFAPTAARPSIAIDRVSLPHRLVIDRVQFTPRVVRSLDTFTARFRVSDTRGFRIQGAVVQLATIPSGQISRAAPVETDETGWATFLLSPTAKLKLQRGGSLYFFVQAKKPGERANAGVSTAILARLRLSAPTTKAKP